LLGRTKPRQRFLTIGEHPDFKRNPLGHRRKLLSHDERDGFARHNRQPRVADVVGVPAGETGELTQFGHGRCGLRFGEIADRVEIRTEQRIRHPRHDRLETFGLCDDAFRPNDQQTCFGIDCVGKWH
jgi:hypothetical protein